MLRDIVKEPWVRVIDINSLNPENVEFTSIEKPGLSTDLLLRFSTKYSSDLYIYLHMEFQTTPEKMGCRILEYLSRIYRRQEQAGGALSPVVPIVIYSSKRKWRENTEFIQKFTHVPQAMDKYLPNFRYFLVDIHSFHEKELRNLKTAVSEFMLLEKTDFKNRKKAISRIIRILDEIKSNNPSIFSLLKSYILGLLEKKSIIEREAVTEFLYDQEDKGMLIESLNELMEEERKKGKLEAAKRMLEKKYPVQDISEITGLSIEEIENLQNDSSQ